MATHPQCRWLTGYAVTYNEAGAAVRFVLPYRFRRRLHRCGAYGRFLPFVQQESTFWKRELMESVDFERLAGFRLAGDYFLWRCFAERADLHVVSAHLGGFRQHAGIVGEPAVFRELRRLAKCQGRSRWAPGRDSSVAAPAA